MISIVAKIPIKEEKVDEAIAALKELMVEVAKEKGTLYYTLNREKKNPNVLVVMERYSDKAALDAHSSSPKFKEFSAKMPDFIGGKLEMSIMEEIASI